ncbi:MAG: hypothetical protein KF878_01280 [Planctomycetes bacterium]|nr:hypothetical protein [Planctomycetota bacterium]
MLCDKTTLRARYDAILAAGCLDPAQQARVRAGEAPPGVVLQQSGGSSGEAPLRLPKARAETAWLIDRLAGHHRRVFGEAPRRVAFVGGVTHLQAGRVEGLFPGGVTRSFRLREWDALVAFQPDLLSCYPSAARDLVVRDAAALGCVRTLKLGGETVLPADRARLLERLPGVLLLEQFGSTEMPCLALRATTRDEDTGYVLSRDRYAFSFEPPGEGWREVVVRDDLPARAFPIPGWYRTGDEALLDPGGRVLALRRRGDPAAPFLDALDALVRAGCTQVQVDLRDRTLRLEAGPEVRLEREVVLGGVTLAVERGPVYRLKDSNKAPLVLAAVGRAPTWRRPEEEA